MIFGSARYSKIFASLTPPVGMKRICGKGAAKALIVLSPPNCAAGKNFATGSPWFTTIISSVGVHTPGRIGILFSQQYVVTSSEYPGVTMNFAPHSIACLHCSTFTTVPAPTSISGKASLIALIESAAAAVRKVTSATGSPPSIKACPKGSASFASSRTTTGTIFSSSTFFNNSCISMIYYLFSIL